MQLDAGVSLGSAFGRDFGLYRAELEAAFSTYEPSGITINRTTGGFLHSPASGDVVKYALLLNNAIDLGNPKPRNLRRCWYRPNPYLV